MNLIIDGNALMNLTANVAIYVMSNNSAFDCPYMVVDDEIVLKETGEKYYNNFVMSYLSGIIVPLSRYVNRIYFVFDSTSWRKILIRKHFDRNPLKTRFEYKGNRKLDENKKRMFHFFDYFQNRILKELERFGGVYTLKIKGAEGDDLISHLNDRLEDSNIIWTVDHDINQLVKSDNRFTIVIGSKMKANQMKNMYYEKTTDSNDLLSFEQSSGAMLGVMEHLSNNKEYLPVPVNPNLLVYNKILCGDKSDNVPCVFSKTGKTGKPINITEKKAESIISRISAMHDINRICEYVDVGNNAFVNDTVTAIKECLSIPDTQTEEIRERFLFNIKLVRLSSSIIPSILTDMMQTEYEKLDRSGVFNKEEFCDYLTKIKTL